MSQVGVDHKTHCRLSWFSSFRNASHTGKRIIERSEIELITTTCTDTDRRQQLIVDGKYDTVSVWIFDASRGLLVLKMHTISAPDQVRYYVFEKVEKAKGGHMCWLCQHSCHDGEHAGNDINTYAKKFVFELDSLRPQMYHIKLTEHASLTEHVE